MDLKQKTIIGIESFFTTWALNRVFRLNPGNLLSVLIFVGCFLFYRYVIILYISAGKASEESDSSERSDYRICRDVIKRSLICSRILGLVFTLFYFLYDRDNYVEDLTCRFYRALMLLAVLAGLYFFFTHVLRFVYFFLADSDRINRIFFDPDVSGLDLEENPDWDDCSVLPNPDAAAFSETPMSDDSTGNTVDGALSNSKLGFGRWICESYKDHMGLWTFVLCLIFFLPYFLYQFPGIMTPDSIVQYEQALHINSYSNHHPWIHTLILEFFYDLGFAFTRNPNISVSLYTIAQMIFMAWSASYVVKTLRLKGLRPIICFLATLFYALVPYNDVFAVTIWKDIPFAGVVAVFVCVLIRLDMTFSLKTISSETDSENHEDDGKVVDAGSVRGKIRLYISLVVLGAGICLLRSNGWYAFIVLTPFLIIHFWKKSKVAAAFVVFALILAAVVRYPVMNACGVEKPDFVESLSIPVQQVASVIVNDGKIDQESMYEIQKVVDLTYISDLYVPTFADNIKELVRAGDQKYLADNKWAFFKIYLKLGLLNPEIYMKAFVLQTYGYFYPDRDYTVADAEGVVSSSLEFSTTPLIGGPVVIKSKEILNKLGNMIPLYSVLWCMGAMFWILLTGISVLIVKGQRRKVIYYLPYLLLVLTVLIATPVATEFRYVYFLMYSIPLILTVCFY